MSTVPEGLEEAATAEQPRSRWSGPARLRPIWG